MRVIDLTDQVFNRWKVLKRMPNGPGGQTRWLCKCSCPAGTEKVVMGYDLRNGTNTSCGCQRADTIRKNAIRHNLSIPPYKGIFGNLMARCKNRKIPITLTYEQFLKFTSITRCHYCGNDIIWVKHHRTGQKQGSINLDRIDSNEGYTEKNCVVCCYRCNVAKNDMSVEEWFAHMKKISEWQWTQQH